MKTMPCKKFKSDAWKYDAPTKSQLALIRHLYKSIKHNKIEYDFNVPVTKGQASREIGMLKKEIENKKEEIQCQCS